MTKRAASVSITYTKHAEERMRLRRITSSMITDTITKPDRTQIEEDGDTEFIRTLNGRKVHVIATRLNEPNEWLIKSTWVRGEEDPLPLWRQLLELLSKAVSSLFNSGSSRSKRR